MHMLRSSEKAHLAAGAAGTDGPVPWRPALSPALAQRAMAVACAAAACIRDRERVAQAVAIAPTQTAFSRTVNWNPVSVAQGDAGLALTCAYLDACFPNDGWDRVGHQYLTVAATAAERMPDMVTGMFGGLA